MHDIPSTERKVAEIVLNIEGLFHLLMQFHL
jgi:hypothetical protein